MAISDQLMKAMDMFSTAASEYGVASGIKDATDAVKKITADKSIDPMQALEAQRVIQTQLQSRLSALNAPASQIAAAVGSVAPDIPKTPEQIRQKAISATTPEEQMFWESKADIAEQMTGKGKLAEAMPTLEKEQEFAIARIDRQNAASAQKERGLTPAQALDLKKSQEMQAVPGLKLKEGFQNRPEAVDKIKSGWAEFTTADSALDELRDLISKRDSLDSLTGDELGRAKSLYGQLQISLKETSNLGALAGPDIEVLGNQLPPVTGFSSLFTKDKTILKTLEATQRGVRARVKNKLGATGYEIPGGKITSEYRKQVQAVQYARQILSDPKADPKLKASANNILEQYGNE